MDPIAFDRPFAITAWYANQHRLLESLAPDALSALPTRVHLLNAMLGRLALEQIKSRGIRSIGRLLLDEALLEGVLFTIEGKFTSKGFRKLDTMSPKKDVELRMTLNEFGDNRTLSIRFNTRGILTSSGFQNLSEGGSFFVSGFVRTITEADIIAAPYVIGDLVLASENGFDLPWRKLSQLDPKDIGIFSRVNFGKRVTSTDLDGLKLIPEARFKSLLIDEIGLSHSQNDWGGEICDIFSRNLLVEDDRVDAAWMLKGPSKFCPLTPKDCGKNGDQIVRLFQAPALLYVLQHCHEVTPHVVNMMRAFSSEPQRLGSKFCIIDGYDTWRICKHFGLL